MGGGGLNQCGWPPPLPIDISNTKYFTRTFRTFEHEGWGVFKAGEVGVRGVEKSQFCSDVFDGWPLVGKIHTKLTDFWYGINGKIHNSLTKFW